MARVKEKQIQVESETQLKMKGIEVDSHLEIASTKLKSQQEENKLNKYKHIIKPFCKEDSISAWTENVEYQLKYHQVPIDMWAMIYMKNLSGEPLKVIESIPTDLRSNYQYIHDRIMQHFLLDAPGYQMQFSNLKPKPSETFIYYVSNVQSVLNRWLSAAKIGKDFEKLKNLIAMDKVISTI